MMVYRNNDMVIYPAIPLATYPTRQLSSNPDHKQVSNRKDFWKDHGKDTQSAVSSPKVDLSRSVGRKCIFLQCKRPFSHAPRRGARRMRPMVAARKRGEGRRL